MQKILFLLLSIVYLSSCDSPMNNRVQDSGGSEKSLSKMEFEGSSWSAEVKWLKGPIPNKDVSSQLLVFLYNEKGELASLPEGDQLTFYSWMPSMGHPAVDMGYFEEISKGMYLNSSIKFNMKQDWEHIITLEDSDENEVGKIQWLEYL